jgi:integrase
MYRAIQAGDGELKGSTREAQTADDVMRLSFKRAIREGLLSRNPMDAVDKPGHVPKERLALSPEVAKRIIITAISSGDETWATRWAMAFLTGARRGELLGLRWPYVDLDEGYVDLAWQLQRLSKTHGCGGTCGRKRPSWCPEAKWDLPPGLRYEECHGSLLFTPPKTKAGTRVLDLLDLPILVAMLRHIHDNQGPNPHGLVFHHRDGRPISPEEDHEAWKQLLHDAEVPDATLHAARHTAATILDAAGVDEQTRMQIMGQSSVIAHRGYIHRDRRHVRKALGHLAELLPPEPG